MSPPGNSVFQSFFSLHSKMIIPPLFTFVLDLFNVYNIGQKPHLSFLSHHMLVSRTVLNIQCVCVCVSSVAQLCPTLCDAMNCTPPGASVHGIFQARILEQVAIS